MQEAIYIAKRLIEGQDLDFREYLELIRGQNEAIRHELMEAAWDTRRRVFGDGIYVRALIEFSGYCRCGCRYCGLNRHNGQAKRFRLTKEEILAACAVGYQNGMRTFVLQSGEDAFFTDEMMAEIVRAVKERYPDCAVTLSVGERSHKAYALWKEAGADRYLLRHETADGEHYEFLHPPEQTFESRRQCLNDLKSLGYQVGSGFMVGSPGQTMECLAKDMMYLKELGPAMIGIGPFIPQKDTEFGCYPTGSADLTVFMLALIRLTFPEALLPATTALGTLGRRMEGFKAGANVVMLNTSPMEARKRYNIYDHKKILEDEAVEGLAQLRENLSELGLRALVSRGDAPSYIK